MPAAPVPRLAIDCAGKTDEEVLRLAVRSACDIEGDTARFRVAFDGDPEIRRKNFDALRKNYPLRRLFSATTLSLSNVSPALRAKLDALGFKTRLSRTPRS